MKFYNWTGKLGPDWNAYVPGNPAQSNWSGGAPGDIPGSDNDAAVFDLGGDISLTATSAHAGEIQIAGGTTLTFESGHLGVGDDGVGGMLIDDDSELDVTGSAAIANRGSLDIVGLKGGGTLVLQPGAAMDDLGMIVGADKDAGGEVTVDAATLLIAQSGTSLTDGVLTVGQDGDGSIDISAGSLFYAASTILGENDGASGTITIEDSTWGGRSLVVGQRGDGAVFVKAGATIALLSVTIGPSGDLSLSGSAASPGVLSADFVTLDFGTIDVAPGGELGVTTAGGSSGAIDVVGALVGLGNVNGNVVLAGTGSVQASLPVPGALTITGNVTGTGKLEPLMTLEVIGGIGAGVQIAFSPSVGAEVGDLVLDVPSADLGTIIGFGVGNTIDVQGSLYSTAVFTAGTAGHAGTLTLSRGGSAALSLAVQGGYAADDFIATPGETDTVVTLVPCLLKGTHIATPDGEALVETLRPGDLVRTASGAARPLRWIGNGHTRITPRNRGRAMPVVVRKHALGEFVPHRDLYITRGHSLFIEGVLIPVEELVNHRTIAWVETAETIEYYHLELDSHDVVIAEGAAAETYREDGNFLQFRNAASRPSAPPPAPYAPVLHEHPTVKRIWRKLSERAGPLDLALTDDPDLHLLADGERLDPEAVDERIWRFQLPQPVSDLRIVSRSAIPSMIGLEQDQRQLGVALRRIVVTRPEMREDIGWDDERLVAGFHGPEPAERHRWTTGEACFPAPLAASLHAGTRIELHVNGLLPYAMAKHMRGMWTQAVATFAVMAVIGGAAPARADWGYTHWGMSPPEVVAASRGTAHLLEASERTRDDYGHTEISVMGTTHEDGVDENVGFEFGTTGRGGLDCVLFNATGDDAATLRDKMVARHGKPAEVSEFGPVKMLRWKTPDPVELDINEGARTAAGTHCAPEK